jgi:hypothetical protein
MNRSLRIVVAALSLLLLVAGTALATRSDLGKQLPNPLAATHGASPGGDSEDASESPEADASEAPEAPEAPDASEAAGEPLTDAHAQSLVDLLKAAGIDATAAQLKTLAATYGVGGAVRLEAWADATGKSVDALAKMYTDGGVGWGAFAHQLEAADSSLHLSPGIGWIMGHGHGNARPDKASHPQAKPSAS